MSTNVSKISEGFQADSLYLYTLKNRYQEQKHISSQFLLWPPCSSSPPEASYPVKHFRTTIV